MTGNGPGGNETATLAIWNAATGARIALVSSGANMAAGANGFGEPLLAFAANGRQIATSLEGGLVEILNLKSVTEREFGIDLPTTACRTPLTVTWSPATRTGPPSGNPRAGGSNRSSDAVGASMQPRRLLVVESRLTGHAGWLAAAVGNQRQAMLVLALRVRKHGALGDLHPPRRRRESNGFLTRAAE